MCLFRQRLFVSKLLSILKGFNESGDPSCTIMQNWARIEVNGFDTPAGFIYRGLVVRLKLRQSPS